jgi:hypothetical protein
MYEIKLSALDGGNLLGFLAALGTFRVLAGRQDPTDVRIRWVRERGWIPAICHPVARDPEALVAALAREVCAEDSASRAWDIGEDLTLSLGDFREQLKRWASAATPRRREEADFLAAFGSDAVGAGPKNDQMSDTEFRTMSGAGHQHFLGFMKELAANTAAEHLTSSLFRPWEYADSRPSLRWDPADYRPHALRAEDPSGDPIRTMRGANRLAVEALPLFPTAPSARRLRTVGFQDRNRETEITWPIWDEPIDIGTLQSLLAMSELQEDEPGANQKSLAARGIVQVFRAKRFTEGKYRNFSPARMLL